MHRTARHLAAITRPESRGSVVARDRYLARENEQTGVEIMAMVRSGTEWLQAAVNYGKTIGTEGAAYIVGRRAICAGPAARA